MTSTRAHESPFQLDPAMPARGLTLWVVPHTHWNREWYLTFEQFRLRLVEVVDRALDMLAADPAFRFTLDGQAVILDDYLAIRPERAEELARRAAEGRLTVGPLYTLPDEYLVGAESLVRNLLAGREACWRHGVRPSGVGYLPDTFGHVAQLPQLLRGFGIDSFVFSRGLGNEGRDLGAIFRWRAPDGSEVLAVPQLGGYHAASQLGHGDRFRSDVDGPAQTPAQNAWRNVESLRCSPRHAPLYDQTKLTDLLLSNGMDHEMPQADITDIARGMGELLPGHGVRVGTYDDYVDQLRSRHRPESLKSHAGELCGGLWENVLRGVNSTRMHLKQANERVERALQAAETLASLAVLRDRSWRYPLGELQHAWRELLRNHPHDSICGCSIDQVHRDMLQRFESAQQVADAVTRRALLALARTRDDWSVRPFSGQPNRPDAVPMAPTLYNVLGHGRTRVVDIELPELLADSGGMVVLARIDDGEARMPQLVERDGRKWARLAVHVPALGTASVKLQLADRGVRAALPPGAAAVVDRRTIENGRYRVHVEDDGSLTITDLSNGRSVSGIGLLEDVGDCGDEYTFCAVGRDEPTASFLGVESVNVVAEGPEVAALELKTMMMVPTGLATDRASRTEDRVPMHVTTVVSLGAGVERVDLCTRLINKAQDHRLRVRFPAPGAGAIASVRAEGHFSVMHRPAVPESSPDWHEPPHNTHHMLGAVSWGSMAVYTRGLPEYEAIPSSMEIAITLLRCVGWLSRDDLAYRSGAAGPQLETPDAQCQGEHVFEYSIALDGALADADLVRAAQDMRFDLVAGPGGGTTTDLVQLDGSGWVLGGLKGAEDGVGVVVRAFNPSAADEAVLAIDGAFDRAVPARLDESIPSPAASPTDVLEPGKIITLRLLDQSGLADS